jgi:hypothetical protein
MGMDKGCFKKGCFGCAGLVVLGIAIPLVLLAMGFVVGAPEERQENQVLEQNLPELERPEDRDMAEGSAPEGASVPDFVERPLMPDAVGGPPAGRVILDLEMGDFVIEPGPPGESLRVEAEYDSGSFDLEERYEIQDDGTWTYRLSFENKVAWFQRLWGNQDIDNKVKLIIPRGYPMEIAGRIQVGQSRVELGGLWLTDLDLRTSTGDHRVSFSEPLHQPLPRLRLQSGVGETRFIGLGNASPAKTYIEAKIGELRVDLTGDWRQDGVVDVEFKIGECRVIVPDDVHLKIDRASVSIGERRFRDLETDEMLPEDAPTITLRADSSIGELRIERAREHRQNSEEPKAQAPVDTPVEAPAEPKLEFPTD